MKEFSTLVNIWRSYNLQAKSLTVSYTPFALHFCRQRCRSRQISLITCVLQTETVIMDNIFKRFFVCSLFGNSSGFLIGGCLVGLPVGHCGAQCDVPSQEARPGIQCSRYDASQLSEPDLLVPSARKCRLRRRHG